MAKKRFFPALLLTLVLALSPLSAFAESGAYAVKFYPGDYGTMTKNDQIPFVYYGIDDDVNKPYYYKLNVSETETLSFAGSIIDTLLPNSGYEFAYWTADAAVYQAGSGTAIPAGTALSSDQIQNSVNVRRDNVIFTAHFKQNSENPDDSEITTVEIIGATLSYKTGDTPKATAAVAAADQGKYRIYDEWWQELNENDEPVAIWHSDDEIYSTLPTITAFESGKKYVYSVLLMPEREYDFAREIAATVNGNAVTAGAPPKREPALSRFCLILAGQPPPPPPGGYYYSPSAGGSSASPKTADAGVALYAAAALLSTAGLAWSSKRHGQ